MIFLILCATLIALCASAEAQQAKKIFRIGWLRFLAAPPTDPTHVAFNEGLRTLGYVEGKNVIVEYRSAEGKPEGRAKAAAELASLKVDVIVTSPAPPLIRAAQQATQEIPIIMTGVFVDPVEAGFVKSLARPGSNITGITNLESDLHPKRLELLKEAFPQLSRMAILWPGYQQTPAKDEVDAAGKALGIQIQPLVGSGGSSLDELERLLAQISKESADALLIATSALTLRYRARIIDFVARRRLPTIYAQSFFVEAGGLMSYGADLPDLFRQAATYVDKILKGAKPADLPVERPRKFEFVINLKTAKQIGLTIPPNVLARADRVIR
jgi:putative ABC transport system substrate-binding protein